jgi:hypothetical protein
MTRKLKQILITLFFLLLIGGFSYLGYRYFFAPNCFDQKQNQNEEGVDCGGPCAKECPLELNLAEIKVSDINLILENGSYDLAAKLTNPNDQYGFELVDYSIRLYEGADLVGEKQGQTYLLPNETVYLIEIGIKSKGKPDNAKVVINNSQFEEFKGSSEPKLEVINDRFNYPENSSVFFETNFQVANRSSYLFYKVELYALVKDRRGNILALNKGFINSVQPGDIRDHRFFWPKEFEGQAASVELKARSNIFDEKNIRNLGTKQ